MRSVKNRILLHLKVLWLSCGKILVFLDKVTCWNDDVILDVLDQGIDKWASYFLDSALDPVVVMEEIPLSGQDT